jgi:chemosensory pili system protein ChpC
LNTAVAVADDTNELSCVVIPTPGAQLLLPNVSIAEIVPWRRIKPMVEGPAWCMGHLGWRGRNVPVIHYAGFESEKELAPDSARCLVVMNRARNPSGPAFYALAAVGLPRMVQLMEDDLQNLDAPLGVADVMQVQVGTEQATIPNLAYIEDCLVQLP